MNDDDEMREVIRFTVIAAEHRSFDLLHAIRSNTSTFKRKNQIDSRDTKEELAVHGAQ